MAAGKDVHCLSGEYIMKTQTYTGRALSLAVASILAVGVGAFSVNSYAEGTAGANLAVSATIAANCSISTTAVSFGTYDPIGTNKSTDLTTDSGKVTTICTNGSAVTVTLGQGITPNTGSTAAVPLRQMISAGTPANKLSYYLYSEATYTTVWGNTASR